MKTALFILQLFPLILKAVVSVEESFPQPGVGSEKLEMIKKILAELAGIATEVLPIVEKVISYIVEFANTIGAFKKS